MIKEFIRLIFSRHEIDNTDKNMKNNFKNPDIASKEEEIHLDYIWCLVGNIVESHVFGEEKEVRIGTKHFTPKAKVYCLPPKWGDGYEKIMVIGRSRKTKKIILVVTHFEYVTNWRKQKVYNPYIIKRVNEAGGWRAEEDVTSILNSIYISENKKEN